MKSGGWLSDGLEVVFSSQLYNARPGGCIKQGSAHECCPRKNIAFFSVIYGPTILYCRLNAIERDKL